MAKKPLHQSIDYAKTQADIESETDEERKKTMKALFRTIRQADKLVAEYNKLRKVKSNGKHK